METPPTLTAEDEQILDRVWDEIFKAKGGVVQGLCFLSDEELRSEWAEVQAGHRDFAPASWKAGLEQRVRDLDAREAALNRGTNGPQPADDLSRG